MEVSDIYVKNLCQVKSKLFTETEMPKSTHN